ncbi:MAG TPA: hypothetical protein VNL14_23885 [Candidatus Acidoferrales bacterium]|nr:hypothetical protein [Candidatus Acidoferrales bacterium]
MAQALDYAHWVEKLEPEDIASIYGRFAPGKNLAEHFRRRFGHALDEEELNQNHQIIIEGALLPENREAERVGAGARARGLNELAEAWLLAQPRVCSVISGATRVRARFEQCQGRRLCADGGGA